MKMPENVYTNRRMRFDDTKEEDQVLLKKFGEPLVYMYSHNHRTQRVNICTVEHSHYYVLIESPGNVYLLAICMAHVSFRERGPKKLIWNKSTKQTWNTLISLKQTFILSFMSYQ